MNIQSLKTNKKLYMILTMVLGLFILCFRLRCSGLWYDECVEYYFSKYMTGTTPGFPKFSNMYQRICFTGQPPLYNMLIWIWLRFGQSELWFRLAGIFTTLFGATGLYLFLQKKHTGAAILLTLIYISAFPTRYFALECAEYNLLTANLLWMLVCFLSYLETKKRSSLILFFTFAVLSIYSQYGAVFVIFGIGFALLVVIFTQHRSDFVFFLTSGIISFIAFIPGLVYFFLLPQMQNQGSKSVNHSLAFSMSLIQDFFISIKDTYFYFFLRDQSVPGKLVLSLIGFFLFLYGLFIIIKSGKKETLIISLVLGTGLSYLCYFFAVKTNYYGFVFEGGTFGNHWALAIGLLLLFNGIIFLLQLYQNHKGLALVIACLILCFHMTSLFQTSWEKDNIKEIVQENAVSLQTQEVVLTYTEIVPFSYYTRDQKISFRNFDKWTYHCENAGVSTTAKNIKNSFGSQLPSKFLLLAGSEDSPDVMIHALQSLGYDITLIDGPNDEKNNLADMPMKSYLYMVKR